MLSPNLIVKLILNRQYEKLQSALSGCLWLKKGISNFIFQMIYKFQSLKVYERHKTMIIFSTKK